MATRTVHRPASLWVTRGRRWDLTARPLVLGVVNVTPDSFSDGGRFLRAEDAIAHGRRLSEEGADLIDVGGESTRPGAAPVAETEELRRVMPVVEALAALGVAVSIDTAKAGVARRALEAGAVVVNDISAGRFDADLPGVAAACGAGYIAMHMRGTPPTMQDAPEYADVVGEVQGFLEERAQALTRAGLAREAIAIDPGIGFGKTVEHNLALLRHLSRLVEMGWPVAVGVSRKSFIGRLTGDPPPGERLPGSLAAALWAVLQGVHILRVHDVAATRQALTVWQSIGCPPPLAPPHLPAPPPQGEQGGAPRAARRGPRHE